WDAAAARGDPPGAAPDDRPGISVLEDWAHGRAGPPRQPAARLAEVSQGPLSLPLLHSRGRHPEAPRRSSHARPGRLLARPGPPDRPAPARSSPVDRALVAGEGPGAASLFLRDRRRHRP